MAANFDLTLVLATPTQLGFKGDDGSLLNHYYALYRSPASADGWQDTWLRGDRDVQSPGGIAFTPDGKHVLVATQAERDWCLEVQPDGRLPYSVSKYRVDQIDLTGHHMGPEVARIDLEAPVAEILPAKGGRIAHLVMVPQSMRTADRAPAVVTIDVERMTESAPRIPIAAIGSPQESCMIGWVPMGVTHATLSPDERFLVTNRWVAKGLNVVNLIDRRSWTLDLDVDPRVFTGGVAFNHGWVNHGLLAVHNGNRVVIYDWTDGRAVDELSRIRVPPAVMMENDNRLVRGSAGNQDGPISSLAWSGSGSHVIAAVNYRGAPEFRSWSVTDDGRTLVQAGDYEACRYWHNAQNDILTGNALLPTRTHTPSPSPTATFVPSPTPTNSPTTPPTDAPAPTSTPSPTHTASPPPTATPTPAPLHLPLLLRESCIPDQRRVDVVLVIDASTSMRDPTALGRPKIEAAIEAARSFLDQLQPARGDQAALVAFNAEAVLLQGLTGDRTLLDAALERVAIARETCLVCGVEVAAAELAGPRHRAEHAATMVVLTDGRSNPRPASEAVEKAAEAKERGVIVFTIGLGSDLDEEALVAMASWPGYAYWAPDAEDLAEIYREIAVAIPCPANSFWGGR